LRGQERQRVENERGGGSTAARKFGSDVYSLPTQFAIPARSVTVSSSSSSIRQTREREKKRRTREPVELLLVLLAESAMNGRQRRLLVRKLGIEVYSNTNRRQSTADDGGEDAGSCENGKTNWKCLLDLQRVRLARTESLLWVSLEKLLATNHQNAKT
jgi:hypothetical protein